MSQEIPQEEELARQILSSQDAKRVQRKNCPRKVFMGAPGVKEISVDRFSPENISALAAIGRGVAEERGKKDGQNRTFYGWAKLTVEQAEENNRRVIASPIEGSNPYHADIILPSDTDDIEYEEQVKHARELADKARWQDPPDLADALQDLAGVAEDAKEDGYPEPSQIGMDNADRLLREMYRYFQIRYTVYPGVRGEVVIQASDGKGHSVMVMCDQEGGAKCFANLESGHRIERYDTADKLPDDFLYGVLDEIKENSQ